MKADRFMRKSVGILLLVSALFAAGSCTMQMDDVPDIGFENIKSAYAIFTARQSDSGVVYLQVNDSTRLYPENMQDEFAGVCRMFGLIRVSGSQFMDYGYRTVVDWSEPIDEGKMQAGFPASGSGDTIDVLDDWMTSVEDGYLTVHYSTFWGTDPVGHSFSLVRVGDPGNPYRLRLVHYRNGDAAEVEGDGLICFDLRDLPETGGEYVDLVLTWLNGEEKDAERIFRFRSRSDSD